MSRRILALSSSKVGNENYLQTAASFIRNFLGETSLRIAFIPFASVGDYEEYISNVRTALQHLPHRVVLADHDNAKEIIDQSDVIMVGGGNTFKLLHDVYEAGVLDIIQKKINNGTPYVGWSAGSNILSPTICTTNDMPIIEPESFKALNIFPFQINPHYYNQKPEGFNGETRDQRLSEYLKLNPGRSVVCLPEGTALLLEDDVLKLLGITNAIVMQQDSKREIDKGENISFLLQPSTAS